MKKNRNWMKWIAHAASWLVVFALLATTLPQPVSAAPLAVKCAYKYKVQSGDTLAYIGYLYTIDWLAIAEANDLKAPYVITVDQTLCIPEGAKAPLTDGTITGDPEKKVQPTLVVATTPNSVVVSVEGFPKQRNYYVRLVPKLGLVTYRLGRLRTNKEGKATENYQVPEYLMGNRQMVLCVKDVLTDAALCVEYENDWWAIYHGAAFCFKNGR